MPSVPRQTSNSKRQISKNQSLSGKKLQTKDCILERQELTCNSTVIARPLLAHVSNFSSSKGENM